MVGVVDGEVGLIVPWLANVDQMPIGTWRPPTACRRAARARRGRSCAGAERVLFGAALAVGLDDAVVVQVRLEGAVPVTPASCVCPQPAPGARSSSARRIASASWRTMNA